MSERESKAVKSRIDRAVCHNTTAHASPLLSSVDQPSLQQPQNVVSPRLQKRDARLGMHWWARQNDSQARWHN